MNKIYRILGKRGRITIPFELRKELGFACNDVVSFEVENNKTIAVRREKICNDCRTAERDGVDAISLRDFLDDLSEKEQYAALNHLSKKYLLQAAPAIMM